MDLIQDEFQALEKEYSSMLQSLELSVADKQCRMVTLEQHWFQVKLTSAGWTVCIRIIKRVLAR